MNLIKYVLVNPENGKWAWNSEAEHHSVAAPKMVNMLDLRIKRMLDDIFDFVRDGMKDTVYNRNLKSHELYNKIKAAKEEFNLHYYMLSEFKRKVLIQVNEKKISPIMSLKLMDSPLNRKHKMGLSHMYEHYDNAEIENKLGEFHKKIDDSIDLLDTILSIWDSMLDLYTEFDAEKLLAGMKSLNEKFKECGDNESGAQAFICSSFFAMDDATKGLIKAKNKGIIKLRDSSEAFTRLTDLILRMYVKSIDNYKGSHEKEVIEKAFEKLKELKLYDVSDRSLQVLKEIKMRLETDVVHESLETCYKKIGEMHSNIHLKLYEVGGLKHLRKYFSTEGVFLVDIVLNEFEKIHNLFRKEGECFSEDKKLIERTLPELEVYGKVLEDLLLECEPGKCYFFLNGKLHNVNSYIASKYYVLDKEDCIRILENLGGDLFRNFINSVTALMFALKKELHEKQDVVDKDDLDKVGIRTGKTTMIDTYDKAVEEILASLGTFIANTLHNLLKEILQNLSAPSLRFNIKNSYEAVESALQELNKDSLSDSQ